MNISPEKYYNLMYMSITTKAGALQPSIYGTQTRPVSITKGNKEKGKKRRKRERCIWTAFGPETLAFDYHLHK